MELLQGLVAVQGGPKYLGYDVKQVPEMHNLIFSRLSDFFSSVERPAEHTGPIFWGAGLVWFVEGWAYEAASTDYVRMAHVFNDQFVRGLFPIDTVAGLLRTLALAFPITEGEHAACRAAEIQLQGALQQAAKRRRR